MASHSAGGGVGGSGVSRDWDYGYSTVEEERPMGRRGLEGGGGGIHLVWCCWEKVRSDCMGE